MCIIHLFNTPLIRIFYRTQVLRIVQIFSKNFDKNFSLHNILHTSLFYFLKSIPKNFQNFSFAPLKILISHFSMFETCNCRNSFCFQNSLLLFFSSLLLKMNSHLNLDFFNTSSLLVQKPANAGSQLIDNTF